MNEPVARLRLKIPELLILWVGLILSYFLASCSSKASGSTTLVPAKLDTIIPVTIPNTETISPNSTQPTEKRTSTPTVKPVLAINDPFLRLAPGKYLVLWSDKILFVRSIDGKLNMRLAEVGDSPSVSISPDNRHLVYSDQGVISVLDLFTNAKTELLHLGRDAYEPSWSPDGNSIVYTFDSNPPTDPSIYIAPFKGEKFMRLTPWSTVERNPAWSLDGKMIAFASDQAKINLPNGSFLGVTDLYILDSSCLSDSITCGEKSRQLTTSDLNGDSSNPAWSPDSRRLVFSCGNVLNERYQKDVCIINYDGKDLNRVTSTVENELWPAWSPDGAQIAFTRKDFDTRQGDVIVISANGDNPINITNTPNQDEVFAFWLNIK